MMNAPISTALIAVGDGENKKEEMKSADGGRWGLTEKIRQGNAERASEIQ